LRVNRRFVKIKISNSPQLPKIEPKNPLFSQGRL
jgi:hypothetical protein